MHIKAFEQYLRYEKRLSPHTLTAYLGDLDQFYQFLKTTYQTQSLEAIEHFHIRSWMVQLITEGMTTATVARKSASLKTLFSIFTPPGTFTAKPDAQNIYTESGEKTAGLPAGKRAAGPF
jgi:integrase/recombinase XerC